MKIRRVSVQKLSAKLTQPFRTAPGQHDDLTNILIGIELQNGIRGFGEAAVATHITGETVSETYKNLSSFKSILTDRDISYYPALCAKAKIMFRKNPCVLAAIEMAILDALTQWKKIPLWKLFGKKLKNIQTDMTVVLGTLEDAEKAARTIKKRGIRAVKIKIGGNHEEDLKRVIAVKRVMKNPRIYLDANQGFTANESLWFLTRLHKLGIQPELIEQPVPKNDWEGLKLVTRNAGIPVIADESVSTLEDAKRLHAGKYANGINIKFMKSGILEAFRIAKFAKEKKLKLMIGGMMESELGTTASAHLASALGFDYIDLDSQFFLKEKVMNRAYVSGNGIYRLQKIKSGIGVRPKRNLFR